MNLTRSPAESARRIVLEPGGSDAHYWRDLWVYRELLYFLALRDILVRYKQTVIGVAWGVVRPILTMLALTWVFGRGARLQTPSSDIPYSLWVMAAMLPWQFFADGLTASSTSLVSNSSMVSKVYFPRLILPISRIIISFVDFSLTFVLLLLLALVYHFTSYRFTPSWTMIFLPLFLVCTFAAAAGLGLLFAALNVKYRDFAYIVPFIVTFGLYVSPVGLSTADFTHGDPVLRSFFSLNPMVGIIDGFRWCVFGSRAPLYLPGLFISLASLAALLWGGVTFFRSSEAAFADFI